ncbi:T9SS type A sorting domain-containing protein, partial [bacterium]|nr:T9SS type A sorting domain-containing protein [bacterium]
SLISVDVSDPEEPEVTDGMDGPGRFEGIFISDEYAYLWENYYGYNGFCIFDIADPEDITVSYRNDTLEVRDMFVTDSVAYLATYDGLVIFEIHDPANPHQFETYKEPINFSGVQVSGNYLYLIYNQRGSSDFILEVANIFHTPDSPDSVGSYNLGRGFSNGKLTVIGDYAFVWRIWDNDIRIIDVSDPEHPDSIGFIETDEYVRDVNIQGDYLYMLSDEQELKMFDISEPGDVIQVGSLEIDEEYLQTRAISVSGNLLYLICGHWYNEGTFYIIDISDPTNPVEIGYYNTPGHGMDVAVSDGLIYVADGNNLGIYRFIHPEGVEPSDPFILHPSSFILYPPHPNPFNSTTTIRYNIEHEAFITLKLYDLTGREVASLVNERQSAGNYQMIWNAEGMPSGVYICRLEASGKRHSTKVVLMR